MLCFVIYSPQPCGAYYSTTASTDTSMHYTRDAALSLISKNKPMIMDSESHNTCSFMLLTRYLFEEQTLFLAPFGGIPTVRHPGVCPYRGGNTSAHRTFLMSCERLFRTGLWFFPALLLAHLGSRGKSHGTCYWGAMAFRDQAAK